VRTRWWVLHGLIQPGVCGPLQCRPVPHPGLFLLAALIPTLALAFIDAPFSSHGQQVGKFYQIGYLGTSNYRFDLGAKDCYITGTPNWQAFMGRLRERGYVPGQNLVIE